MEESGIETSAVSTECGDGDEIPQMTTADGTADYTVVSRPRDDQVFLQVFEAELVSPQAGNTTLSDAQEICNQVSANLANDRQGRVQDATLEEAFHGTETNYFFLWLLSLVIFLVALICVISTFAIIRVCENEKMYEKASNDLNAESEADNSYYLSTLRNILLGADAFRLDTNAPQLKATEWMAFEDLPRVDFNMSFRLKQRFALATLYFGMGGEDWDLESWLQAGRHECQWELVSCSEVEEVTKLSLGGSLGLTGSLVEEIGLLTSLTSLDLSSNRIEGSIPIIMYNLSNLVSLDLKENEMVGHIDSSIYKLQSLQVLKLSLNYFSGKLPEELKFIHDLRIFDIHKNPLHGNIWSLMESWTKLEKFVITETMVSGTIPPNSMKNMPFLRELHISRTLIEGTIPTEIGELSSLISFNVGSSPLYGSIPSEIGKLVSLELLVIETMSLWGSIPSEIGMCTSLLWISLSQTNLNGTLPSEIGKLSKLNFFSASHNNLQGAIPEDFSNLKKLVWLDLEANILMSGTIPRKLCNYLEGGRMTCSISCLCCLDYSFECITNNFGALKGYEMRIN